MRLFGRKKKNEDEEEDVEEEESPKPRKRKPREKKEPAKPWGRKERILVVLFVFLTVLPSAYFALSSRSWKLPGWPRVKTPSISIPFFSNEKIVIEGNKLDVEKAENVTGKITDLTKDLSGVYGIYVIRLDKELRYGIGHNEVFQAASLIKLPIMAAMYKADEEGVLELDEIHVLRETDKVGGSGSLATQPAGYELSYREIVQRMARESDNTAQAIAINTLGRERIKEYINLFGMANTSLDTNETTPEDLGWFLEDLYKGRIANERNKIELLDYLTDTIYEEWITKGVDNDIRVAHKYGREVNVVNDAGIIFAERPYVLVIMSKGIIAREADNVIPEISRFVYEAELVW